MLLCRWQWPACRLIRTGNSEEIVVVGVGGWCVLGGGLVFQKITRLPTSSCSKSYKGAYIINIYVSLSLSVFTKTFAVLYKDLSSANGFHMH